MKKKKFKKRDYVRIIEIPDNDIYHPALKGAECTIERIAWQNEEGWIKARLVLEKNTEHYFKKGVSVYPDRVKVKKLDTEKLKDKLLRIAKSIIKIPGRIVALTKTK